MDNRKIDNQIISKIAEGRGWNGIQSIENRLTNDEIYEIYKH